MYEIAGTMFSENEAVSYNQAETRAVASVPCNK